MVGLASNRTIEIVLIDGKQTLAFDARVEISKFLHFHALFIFLRGLPFGLKYLVSYFLL